MKIQEDRDFTIYWLISLHAPVEIKNYEHDSGGSSSTCLSLSQSFKT